jgi:hypothetical protein
MSFNETINLPLVCPYCHIQQIENINRILPSTEEVSCKNLDCSNDWHEGVYKTIALQIEQRDKRGLGRNHSINYCIRYRTRYGERLINFNSLDKNLIMNKGDYIALSYKKKSIGFFSKQWTGEWENAPKIFQNITLKQYWEI